MNKSAGGGGPPGNLAPAGEEDKAGQGEPEKAEEWICRHLIWICRRCSLSLLSASSRPTERGGVVGEGRIGRQSKVNRRQSPSIAACSLAGILHHRLWRQFSGLRRRRRWRRRRGIRRRRRGRGICLALVFSTRPRARLI
ncbi:unnamed protein product [Linum trigynum]|uniref:Uncharacterized protein n=1 Tax=Linum trigynum TaxID=586398 RepID=A0AAV2CRN0_9ROSI